MTDQTQAQEVATNQPQIKIGFEASLELLNPNWRTEFAPEQVNHYRFFYQAAMRDLSMFIGSAKQTNDNMVQAFQFMDKNAVETNNNPVVDNTEAEAQSAAIAKASKPTKAKTPAKPSHKAPAKPASKAKAKR